MNSGNLIKDYILVNSSDEMRILFTRKLKLNLYFLGIDTIKYFFKANKQSNCSIAVRLKCTVYEARDIQYE